MLSRFSYLETAAVKKRVLYVSESVIYEGMPVCYDYDTTANVDGYDATDGAGIVTDEGHQCEGKYVRVTDPEDNALMHFAGVVAGSSLHGVTGNGAQWLDIYIPNGAIVPVRCDVDTIAGITLLAITVDSQEFGQPVEGTSRVVALAMETEDALGAGADITLARLDDRLSIYQDLDGTALSVAADGTADLIANSINVTSAQTSGKFCALQIKATVSAGGASAYKGLAFYAEAKVTATPGAPTSIMGAGVRLHIAGGTPTETITAFQAYLKEDTAVAMDSLNSRVSVLSLGIQMTHAITATHGFGWIYLEDNSAQPAQQLILSSYLETLPAIAFTGAVTIDYTKDYAIKVLLSNNPGTQQWYIPLINRLQD